ncbi:hypothetical protein SPHINGO391_360088 [Sphingomonas aurantiaca]|uniref:Uncharacterized protein n=1 Tax=Sphingomonas aurantiaca TaxID=185949 RepID=A0A5E7YGM9_9SPHN|nr:hypothetical protein SPHINGO391_360088 [Sphingomonas aurantiaca]
MIPMLYFDIATVVRLYSVEL